MHCLNSFSLWTPENQHQESLFHRLWSHIYPYERDTPRHLEQCRVLPRVPLPLVGWYILHILMLVLLDKVVKIRLWQVPWLFFISLIIYHHHYHPIPSDIMQYHQVSSNIIYHHAISSNIMQYHPTLCNIIQHHAISFNILRYRPISSNTPTSFNITQYHRNHLTLLNQSKIHSKYNAEDIWWLRFLLYLSIEVENTFIRSGICLEIISNYVRVLQTLRKF